MRGRGGALRKGIRMMHEKQRRMCALRVGVVLLLLHAPLHAEDRYSAAEILADCQSILQSAKSSKNQDELDLENTFSNGTCWGAFLSIQQIIVTKIEGEKNSILQICAPPETTSLQIIQIFDVFARGNARRQDEPFTKIAIAALRSAFPCK